MGRRGQECRCCQGCSDCETTPTVLKSHIVYPEPGSGNEIIAGNPPAWTSVTTTCGVPAERVMVVGQIFIIDPGEGYTSPPVLSLTGVGGTLSAQTITIESPVSSFAVTKAGTGYSTAPAVTFSVPAGGGRITTASAIARVEGTVSTLTLTSGGSGYSSPPAVTFAAGTGATASVAMNGYVAALQLTNPGSGYSSTATVTISGGGGSGATAAASRDSKAETISGLFLGDKGSGYTTAPTVTISGGGGEGATATASILFEVQSISLTAGGSGYPPNPEVTVSGGGGSGATATAKISGSVVGVDVLNPGLYINSNINTGGTSFPNWPTVTLSGGGGSGAAATPVFSGKLRSAVVVAGGYSSAPTVTFSGGGGTGAAGIAQLEWERDHVRLNKVVDCFALFSNNFGSSSDFLPTFLNCLDAAAEVLPPRPAAGCLDSAELLGWVIEVQTDADGFSDLLESQNFPGLLYFPGEAVRAAVLRAWGTNGIETESSLQVYQQISTFYTKRFFSRVDPVLVYRIGIPAQSADNNVTLTPTFRQYADGAGEPYWYLESIVITDPGQNLRIPIGTTTCQLAADGNSRHVVGSAAITVTRSAPVVTVPLLDGWSVQPVIAVTVSASGGGGLFVVSAVAVTSGGTTDQDNGTFFIDLVLTTGHFNTEGNRIQLLATITDGSLSAVAIANATSIFGPATLATIELPADPNFDNNNRRVTGESLFTTTRNHSQPTVTASAQFDTDEGPVVVEFAVSLAEASDLNGEAYWYVEGLSGDVPSEAAATVIFEVQAPGIEASPAMASAFSFIDDEFNEQQVKRIFSGGKYFVRTTTPTSQPLPPMSCVGEITAENGWQVNEQQLIADWRDIELGENFGAKYQVFPGGPIFAEVARTRRCGLPTITLELE